MDSILGEDAKSSRDHPLTNIQLDILSSVANDFAPLLFTADNTDPRGLEEQYCVVLQRSTSASSKSSNTRYRCRFCNFEFTGGPQKIRVHLAGKSVKTTRVSKCSKVPDHVRELMLGRIKKLPTAIEPRVVQAPPPVDCLPPRNWEEKFCFVLARADNPKAKHGNSTYRCTFCEVQFIGGPQKIRVHLTGQLEGSTRVVRCTRVPPEIVEEVKARSKRPREDSVDESIFAHDLQDAKKPTGPLGILSSNAADLHALFPLSGPLFPQSSSYFPALNHPLGTSNSFFPHFHSSQTELSEDAGFIQGRADGLASHWTSDLAHPLFPLGTDTEAVEKLTKESLEFSRAVFDEHVSTTTTTTVRNLSTVSAPTNQQSNLLLFHTRDSVQPDLTHASDLISAFPDDGENFAGTW